MSETQERVLQEVTPDAFEDTLYSVLQYTSQVITLMILAERTLI